MSGHVVRGKVKAATARLDRRAFLALGGGALATALMAAGARKARAEKLNLDGGVAIKGHDPVAYFVSGEAVPGDPAITADHDGATYRFASAENRQTFLAEPGRYAPQYGGFCAYAVANGYTAPIDPEAFTVHDGKLYLNFSKGVRSRWERDIPGNITRGDANWPSLSAG
ncbi:YHS domain-containing (seleno)protein [Roseitalea porphyridii]|uniref:YHS domain protein n=1 Tax=Roseitalea porphyridii TaxID=1852022 RepID=A0A4V1A3R2_9HYPH|nr:YHS domain-containing (seleno)protein [Roseitalea porphyridii]QBK30008.1 YHS domain protein [Roseitalea porphyridii]